MDLWYLQWETLHKIQNDSHLCLNDGCQIKCVDLFCFSIPYTVDILMYVTAPSPCNAVIDIAYGTSGTKVKYEFNFISFR